MTSYLLLVFVTFGYQTESHSDFELYMFKIIISNVKYNTVFYKRIFKLSLRHTLAGLKHCTIRVRKCHEVRNVIHVRKCH